MILRNKQQLQCMTLMCIPSSAISSTRLGGSSSPLSTQATTPLAVSRLAPLSGLSPDERRVRDRRRRTICCHPPLSCFFLVFVAMRVWDTYEYGDTDCCVLCVCVYPSTSNTPDVRADPSPWKDTSSVVICETEICYIANAVRRIDNRTGMNAIYFEVPLFFRKCNDHWVT